MKIDSKDFEVYDAKDKILGRLATQVAKQLLSGKKIAIINAEQAIMSGSKRSLKAKYQTRLDLQEKENPEHSPYWSRRPDFLVKRVVRGMLPYHRKPIGKAAYERLVVFVGVPEEFKGIKPIEIRSKDPRALYSGYTRISELTQLLGYNR